MIVDGSHFAYLRLQKGSLDHLAGDPDAWLAGYERSLLDDLASLAPHLPAKCASVLDIGSGLGGIDVLLDRHYGGNLKVRLVDGLADPPRMTLHNRTFNDMNVAEDFQRRNGVRDIAGWPASVCRLPGFVLPEGAPSVFDLVISLGSWCFHFPPLTYLAFVQELCRPGTVLILDVRAGKTQWRAELRQAFDEVAVARSAAKFERVVFHAHARTARATARVS